MASVHRSVVRYGMIELQNVPGALGNVLNAGKVNRIRRGVVRSLEELTAASMDYLEHRNANPYH